MSHRQWASAQWFNDLTKINPETCQYVFLLEKTFGFQIEKDLKRALKINRKPIIWFIQTFQQHRVRVEYVTLFTQKELSVFGPLASQLSYGIAQKLFQKRYGNTKPIFVAQPWCVKKLWTGRNPFHVITSETFRDRITG